MPRTGEFTATPMPARSGPGLFLVLALPGALLAAPALGQKLWNPTGVAVAPRPPAWPSFPVVVGVGGGAFVGWTDYRESAATAGNAYLQHLLPSGVVAPGWAPDGIGVSIFPRDQSPAALVPDGEGGVLVFWDDTRALQTGGSREVYAQRRTSEGLIAPGWPEGGLRLFEIPGQQSAAQGAGTADGPVAISDGNGGAIIRWLDFRNDPAQNLAELYALRVTGDGSIAAGWPADGFPVQTGPGGTGVARIITDGAGGAIIVWTNARTGLSEIYGLRIHGDGTIASGWNVNGNLLCEAPNHQFDPWPVPDGAGGVYVAFGDLRSAPPIPDPVDYLDVYVTHFTAAGARAPGWPAGGVPVCTTFGPQALGRACSAGPDGAFVAWTDMRETVSRISRVTAAGAVASGFGQGKSIAVPTGAQILEGLVADEVGGAYAVWSDDTPPREVWAQRVGPDGTPAAGWPAEGLPTVGLPDAHQLDAPAVGSDGAGGVIVVWEDYRPHYIGLYAQRFGVGGPTPVQVSLVSAEAEAHLVRLTWYAPQGSGITATVERRTVASDWIPLGAPNITSDGYVRYADRTVIPGARYAYRLGYSDGTGVAYTPETWVDVPIAARFALRGLSPNPSQGDPLVAFSLGGGESAALEVYDLHGRLVTTHEVGGLGAGAHQVRLGERGRLPVGVYAVRLREGTQLATARAVVIR
jgi:hypothetical protein